MQETKFEIVGTNVYVFRLNSETTVNILPPRVYEVSYQRPVGFYLSIKSDRVSVPEKIYGNAEVRAAKCIETFRQRPNTTGILMTGDKGTGKTLLSSVIINKAIEELHIPVLLITQPYVGQEFMSFIDSIGECCIVFDEFGKMYRSNRSSEGELVGVDDDEKNNSQSALLTLFDGVNKTKRLIILTENNEYYVNEFFLNRPGRIFYHFKYRKLDEDSIIGFCKDKNVPDNITNDIISISRRSRVFSFDVLQAIVEEYLRYQQPIEQTVEDLNIDIRSIEDIRIRITRVVDRTTNKELSLVEPNKVVFRPVDDTIRIEFYYDDLDENGNRKIGSTWFNDNELVYESDKKLVYQSGEYLVHAVELPSIGDYNYDAF